MTAKSGGTARAAKPSGRARGGSSPEPSAGDDARRRAEQVIEKLIAARLLVSSEAEGGHENLEVIHETLLSSWPRLVKWQREDAEGARLQDQLRQAARQWDERDRPRGMLWRGEALDEYRFWRSRYPRSLTEVERAFAHASLAEAARSARLRRGVLAGSFAVLVVIAVVLVWMYRRAESQRALARDLAHTTRAQLAATLEGRGRQYALTGELYRGLAYLEEAYELGERGPGVRFLYTRGVDALSEQLSLLRGHTDLLFKGDLSPDGTRAVTASFDGTARIWDATTGRTIAVLRGHGGAALHVVFSPDATRVLTTDLAGVGRVWDAATGELVATFSGHRADCFHGGFSRDGARVVTASNDNTAAVWDAATGALQFAVTHVGQVKFAAFTADGRYVLTGSKDGSAGVWDARTGAPAVPAFPRSPGAAARGRLAGHTDTVQVVKLHPDGRRLLTVSWDKTAVIWDLATGSPLVRLRGHRDAIWDGEFSRDGARVVTGSFDKTARVWDTDTGQLLVVLHGHEGSVSSARFGPDGARVLTSSYDGTARIWDVRTGKPLTTLLGHLGHVWHADASADFTRVLTASQDNTGRVWEPHTRGLLRTIEIPAKVWAATYRADGRELATVSSDGMIRRWDPESGAAIAGLSYRPAHSVEDEDQIIVERITANYHPTRPERLLVTRDDRAVIWDLEAGRELVSFDGHAGKVQSALFDPSGARVVTAGYEGTAVVWDADTGARVLELPGHGVELMTAAFSPDGRRVATASRDNTARVWDLEGRELARFSHAGPAWAVRFSPDGRHLLTAGGDQVGKVWDLATGEQIATLEGHKSDIWVALYSPDGRFIVTVALLEGVARVWTADGRALADYALHTGRLNWAEFSPDGTRLVTCGDGGSVRIWDVHLDRRELSELIPLVRCRNPFALVDGQIELNVADPAKCPSLAE